MHDPSLCEPLEGLTTRWQSLVARDHRPIGFRLALQSRAPDGNEPLTSLLDDVLTAFVGEGAAAFPHGMVLLAPQGFALPPTLPAWTAPRNVYLEVSQDELDEERVRLLYEAQRRGVRLALRLAGSAPPPRDRLQLFSFIVGGGDAPSAALLPPNTLLRGDLAAPEDADAALVAGAHAVVGWPLVAPSVARPLEPLQRSVLETIRLVQADADLPVLERAFRADPLLAFMLLTLVNSPAFVRPQKIASLSQAILVLGYARLVKWLVLLLVIASKDKRTLPAIFAAVARGFCMEFVAAATGEPRSAQDDAFVVGAFSLLDVITGQSPRDLFAELDLPAPLLDALVSGSGPYGPLLALARAFETGDGDTLDAAARAAGVPLSTANATMLRALAATDALQTMV